MKICLNCNEPHKNQKYCSNVCKFMHCRKNELYLTEKQFNKCSRIKSIKNYIKNTHNKNSYRNICRKCIAKYDAKRMNDEEYRIKRRKVQILRYNKHREYVMKLKDKPCQDCNKKYPPHVMDYDHRNKKEKCFTISKELGYAALDKIMVEIKKCDLVCANCHRIRTHEHHKTKNKKPQAFVRAQKDKPCTDCGIKYPYYIMEFDHVRGEKLFNIASRIAIKEKTKEKIQKEIDKCNVVCANCHRMRTFDDKRK